MSDLTKSPEQILIDLVNTDNGTALTAELITLGVPAAAAGDAPRNTSLVITAVPGSGYRGDVTVRYNRVDLPAIVPEGGDTVFQLGDRTRVADLIPEINARFNVNLTPTDFADADLPAFTGEANERHDFTLAAAPESLVFIGEVTFTVAGEEIDLASIVTTTDLDGLTPPDANAPQ